MFKHYSKQEVAVVAWSILLNFIQNSCEECVNVKFSVAKKKHDSLKILFSPKPYSTPQKLDIKV